MEGIFTYIGLITTIVIIAKAFSLIRIYLLPSKLHRFIHNAADGRPPWALVTGASDGIGRALSHELASKGLNVVLHGRNKEKLSKAMADLQGRFPERSFRILIADASQVRGLTTLDDHGADGVDFHKIKATLDDLHLTILINNAGGNAGDPICQPLSESPESRVTANISLNALFPAHLMRTLLPNLAASGGPALIVNVSSMADQGFPLLATYSASKQFLMNMTRAVRLEMGLEGTSQVEVLGVKVGRVTDVGFCREEPSLFMPDARTEARAILDRVGHGHGIVVAYWAHALQHVGVSVLPAWVEDRVIMKVMQKERQTQYKTN